MPLGSAGLSVVKVGECKHSTIVYVSDPMVLDHKEKGGHRPRSKSCQSGRRAGMNFRSYFRPRVSRLLLLRLVAYSSFFPYPFTRFLTLLYGFSLIVLAMRVNNCVLFTSGNFTVEIVVRFG